MTIEPGRVIVITGAMAAGKSTVAQLVAERLPRSVHLRGDVFRRMIVNGSPPMSHPLSPAAQSELTLRYDLAAQAADRYAASGYDVVCQDVILGPELASFLPRITTRPRFLVVLAPSVSVLEDRERGRPKVGYTTFEPSELDAVLRTDTARLGYWLDTSRQTPAESAAEILRELPRAEV